MSDSDEAADGQTLAYREAYLLHVKKPDHPLLKYVLRHDDDAVWEEFVAKFGKPGLSREEQRAYPAQSYMWAKFWVALRQANENPDAEIVVDHSPPVIRHAIIGTVRVTVPPDDLDDDLPF